jgi:putative addiction module component (TIGR02574 family)
MNTNEKLLKEALELSSSEKSQLIEQLIISLDQPDPKLDSVWKKEVEERIDAYGDGKIASVSVKEAFKKYKQ